MTDQSGTSVDTADVQAIDRALLRDTGSGDYGLTDLGFVPKPYARLLAESLALAQELLGADIDIRQGSVIRKLLELSSLEHARTQAMLAAMYDDLTVGTAKGAGLSRLGDELGLPRPFLQAAGSVTLKLLRALPAGTSSLTIPEGARMLTPGGHHVATQESAILSAVNTQTAVAVAAFYPGPEHNLDPGDPNQLIQTWNVADRSLTDLISLAQTFPDHPPPEQVVAINHTQPLRGGDLQWPDDRYRSLLLRAPRSTWTVDAIRVIASLVPGVRQVQVQDSFGGLDIDRAIFGNFNFIERVFSSERDISSPYFFSVLVAPTPAAIWDGPDGLCASIAAAIEDLRPIGIYPDIRQAQEIGVGVSVDLVVRGLPLPSADRATVNASSPAMALKARLLERVRRYIDGLDFGEPVRAAQVGWAILNDPNVADIQNLSLVRYPPELDALSFTAPVNPGVVEVLELGRNIELAIDQIARSIDDPSRLNIV